jgi:hypothetical protein
MLVLRYVGGLVRSVLVVVFQYTTTIMKGNIIVQFNGIN